MVDPALRRLHGESVRAEEAIQELDRERRGVHVQGEGELVLDDALHEYPAKLRQLGELGLTRHHRGVLRALVRDGAADLLHAAFDEPPELVALLRLAHDTNFERSNRLLGGEARGRRGAGVHHDAVVSRRIGVSSRTRRYARCGVSPARATTPPKSNDVPRV